MQMGLDRGKAAQSRKTASLKVERPQLTLLKVESQRKNEPTDSNRCYIDAADAVVPSGAADTRDDRVHGSV